MPAMAVGQLFLMGLIPNARAQKRPCCARPFFIPGASARPYYLTSTISAEKVSRKA